MDASNAETTSRKSLGCERTFSNLSSQASLRVKLRELCETVASELAENELFCHTVTLKMKTSKFELHTRSASAKGSSYIQSAEAIFGIAEPLLQQMLPIELRLMGVTASNFKDSAPLLLPGQGKISDYFAVSSCSSAAGHGVDSDYAGGGAIQLEKGVGEDSDWLFDNEVCHASNEHGNGHSECVNLTNESEGDLECPVCSNARFSSLNDLNVHIDICLNTKFLMEEDVQIV